MVPRDVLQAVTSDRFPCFPTNLHKKSVAHADATRFELGFAIAVFIHHYFVEAM